MSRSIDPKTRQTWSKDHASPNDTENAMVEPRSGKRRRKQRKRQRDEVKSSSGTQQEKSRSSTKRKRHETPLMGMIVAVSTLDVKGEAHKDSTSSYKAIADLCQRLGASVTGQLHKRVTCLVCNESAVQNATQRVRKAVKKQVPLVDVAWLRQCHEQGKRVDHENYRLDDVAAKVIESRSASSDKDGDHDAIDVSGIPESAWSEPTTLGCCCVCHENGDDKCPWCSECNVNKAKTQT